MASGSDKPTEAEWFAFLFERLAASNFRSRFHLSTKKKSYVNEKGIQTKKQKKTYDRDNCRPVLRCSICTGEQVAGFKDIHTGKFEEVTVIHNDRELNAFMEMYGIEAISKEY